MKISIAFLFLLITCSFFSCKENDKKDSPPARPIIVSDTAKHDYEPSNNPYAAIDISPMDMSYFPVDYPKLKMAHSISTAPVARVIYSRPHLQGRQLFHGVLKYDEPWRLGANEATELDLYKDVKIQDKSVKAGRYVLYCIPTAATWTIILNSNIDSWGLQPDSTKDVVRFPVPAKQVANHLEYYTMTFEKTSTGADLIMAWDDMETRLPLIF